MYLSFPMPVVVIIIWFNWPVSVFTSRPQAPWEQGQSLLLYTTASPGLMQCQPIELGILWEWGNKQVETAHRNSSQGCSSIPLLWIWFFNSMTHGSFFPVHQSHLSDLRSALLHFPLACSAHDGISPKTPIAFFLLFPFLPAPPYRNMICTQRTISHCPIIRCLFLPLPFGFEQKRVI